MSDMWQVPDDLADRVRDANYKDAWEREIEHTAQVRGILRDLIADLREAHRCSGSETLKGAWCDPCGLPWPCHSIASTDRAEQRLREVSGE